MFPELKQLWDNLKPHLTEMRNQAKLAGQVVKEWWKTAVSTKQAIMISVALVWVLSGLQIIARPPVAGYLYFGSLVIMFLVAATSPERRKA